MGPAVDPTSTFYVLAKGVDPSSPFPAVTIGATPQNLVPAAFLANPTGSSPYVVDPNAQNNSSGSVANSGEQIYQYNSSGVLVPVSNPNNYLIVPQGFTLASTADFIGLIQYLVSQ